MQFTYITFSRHFYKVMRRFVYIPISQNANSSAGSGGRRQTYKPMFCRTAPYASNVFIIENFHTSSITKYCYTGNHLPSFTPNTTEWLFFFFLHFFSFWLCVCLRVILPVSLCVNLLTASFFKRNILNQYKRSQVTFITQVFFSLKFPSIIQQLWMVTNEFQQYPFMFSSKIMIYFF